MMKGKDLKVPSSLNDYNRSVSVRPLQRFLSPFKTVQKMNTYGVRIKVYPYYLNVGALCLAEYLCHPYGGDSITGLAMMGPTDHA